MDSARVSFRMRCLCAYCQAFIGAVPASWPRQDYEEYVALSGHDPESHGACRVCAGHQILRFRIGDVGRRLDALEARVRRSAGGRHVRGGEAPCGCAMVSAASWLRVPAHEAAALDELLEAAVSPTCPVWRKRQ